MEENSVLRKKRTHLQSAGVLSALLLVTILALAFTGHVEAWIIILFLCGPLLLLYTLIAVFIEFIKHRDVASSIRSSTVPNPPSLGGIDNKTGFFVSAAILAALSFFLDSGLYFQLCFNEAGIRPPHPTLCSLQLGFFTLQLFFGITTLYFLAQLIRGRNS